MNHLFQQNSDHDHPQVMSTDPHMIDCSFNGFSVPRFHDEMKEEAAVEVALQGSDPEVLRVMHAILFPKGVLTQDLYRRMWKQKLQLQASQEPLLQASQEEPQDKTIYELEGMPWPSQVFDLDSEASAKRMASLCAVASHLCYQKRDVIKDVVNRMWNMWFVEFFDCLKDTQAFMFTDRKENPNAVTIVFRGTELNAADWGTDLDFFYYPIQGMGQVHGGFLAALGLLRKSCDKAAAAAEAALIENDPKKSFAYDAICDQLRTILLANPEAKVFVTGHSLGGALAALFTAFLTQENDGIQSKLAGVFTFGQPRVGDASFAQYMEKRLCAQNNKARKYFRVVFMNDVVPRVPPDDVLFRFKHISPCVYYKSFQDCEIMEEEPNKNLLSDILQPMAYIAAIKSLFQSHRHQTDSHGPHNDSHGSFHAQLLQEEDELRACVLEILAPAACAHSCLRYIEAVKKAPSAFLKRTT